MSGQNKIGLFFGFLAGGILAVFSKSPPRRGVRDFKQAEFGISTQRLGIRFTEKIREVFRFKWLKKY